MTEINTLWLFSTPVAIFNLSDFVTDDVNHALQNIGYTTNSLVDGIRGDADPSKIPALKPLYNKFQECIDEYSNRIGIHTSYIYESWMNILSMNGSVGVHRHYDSVISGAYYPYVDEGSAPITFVSATEGFRMLDVQHTRKDAPGNSIRILPVCPSLTMFGCVTPNLSIRLLKTPKADSTDSSTFFAKTFFT